jgi:hypothetical protein
VVWATSSKIVVVVEVLLAGTTGATFCVFRLVTRFGCVVVGDGIGAAVVDGAGIGAAVVDGDGDGAVVVVDEPELDCEEYLLSTDVIVNAVSLPLRFLNSPTAVQFPGNTHETELRLASGDDSF